MKKAGVITFLIGIAGLIYFGIQAYNDSGTFNALGVNVAVTKANWTPVFISGAVAVIGFILLSRENQNS